MTHLLPFSVPCSKLCTYCVCINHICRTSFTVTLLHQQNVIHHCHIMTLCLGSFSSALYETFTPIVQLYASCNQSWLFGEMHCNCQRHKLSSPSPRVVTVRVCSAKSKNTLSVVLHHAVTVETIYLRSH